MKKIIFLFILIQLMPSSVLAQSQGYGNDWVIFDDTYGDIGLARPWYIDVGDGDNAAYPRGNVIGAGGLQVNTCTGNLFLTRSDLYIPSRGIDLNIKFSYNSGETKYNYGYGAGWTHTFNILYERFGSDICVKRWDGNRDTFKFSSGYYTPPLGCYDSLTQYSSGKFRLRMKYGGEIFFDDSTHGKVTRIRDRNGNTISITYSGGYPRVITDANGRRLSFSWSGGKMTQLRDSISSPQRTISYQYNADGDLILVTDPMGNSIKYGYDYAKRLTLMTDPMSTHFYITYDDSGAVTRIQSLLSDEIFSYNSTSHITTCTKDGTIQTYTYDGMNRLTEIAGACCGYLSQFVYDSFNNITSLTDANGYITIYTYDSRGNRLTETDPLTHTTTFTYEPVFNQVTGVTDKNGNITTYTYDSKGNCTGINKPLGITLSYTYDSYGNMATSVDGRGLTTTFTYDGNNRLTTVTHPIGTESFMYDNSGNILSYTDANGNATNYTYDYLNRRLTEQNALGEQTSFSYDANGNVLTLTSANGNQYDYTYDGLNRKLTETDGLGTVQSYSYDAAGNLASSRDGNGITTTFTYDGNNRLTAKTRSGVTESYTYDAGGRMLTSTEGNGNTTDYTYDGMNRKLTSSIGGITVSYTYDAGGRILTSIDGKGNSTNFTYDGLNRKITETYPDGRTINYTYDGNDNIINRTNPDGKTTNYTYDGLNRLTLRDFPGANDDHYTYDAGGRMLTATNNNADGGWTYDMINRKLTETVNGHTTHYSYNTATRNRTITYPGGTVVQETRNLRERIVSVSRDGINVGFAYDPGNRLSRITHQEGGELRTDYNYNNRDLVTAITRSYFGVLMDSVGYEYDNADNLKVFRNAIRSEVYGYNELNWLTSFKRGSLVGNDIPSPTDSSLYSYDNAGNWTSVDHHGTTTYTSNNLNQYTTIAPGGTLTYGPKGNLGTGINFTGSYDQENRLTTGTDSTEEIWGNYIYDALGRRVKKETIAGIINYYYDGYRIIEERNGADIVTATYTFGDEGIDDLLSLTHDGTTYYYVKNTLGSVVAMMNSVGAAVERYEYDAWGQTTIWDGNYSVQRDSSHIGNRFMFTSREYDAEIGMYNYRAREYDPELGRFLQRDPIVSDENVGLYSYVNNNPISGFDPLGLANSGPYGQSLSNLDDNGIVAVKYPYHRYLPQQNSHRKEHCPGGHCFVPGKCHACCGHGQHADCSNGNCECHENEKKIDWGKIILETEKIIVDILKIYL
ncbi:MAG: RHS repeat protein [Ignavibacteriales bacterium]|nr:RHS repeat protein [Ignavibacteriales bacterium]